MRASQYGIGAQQSRPGAPSRPPELWPCRLSPALMIDHIFRVTCIHWNVSTVRPELREARVEGWGRNSNAKSRFDKAHRERRSVALEM